MDFAAQRSRDLAMAVPVADQLQEPPVLGRQGLQHPRHLEFSQPALLRRCNVDGISNKRGVRTSSSDASALLATNEIANDHEEPPFRPIHFRKHRHESRDGLLRDVLSVELARAEPSRRV